MLGRAPSGFQLTNAQRWLPAEELLRRRWLFTACRGSGTSLPSPLCFPPRPQGSGAASRPCKAQLHTPAPARPPLAQRMPLPTEAVVPGCPSLRGARCGMAPARRDFPIPFAQQGGTRSTGTGDRVDSPATASPLRVLGGCGALRSLALATSRRRTPASPRGGGEGREWAGPPGGPGVGGKAPGSRLAPTALATTGAAETLRRVGAARSHLPLIEFICYNPKQCKAGFSQAPAACLPIKIPSRTANPPSRLDIKQPVSKKRQAKSPCTRADPPHPILLPQGRWPAGLRVPSRVASGEIRILQGDPKPPA